MTDRSPWPATSAGETLRELVAARHRRRAQSRLAILSLAALLPCAVTAVWAAPVLLVWNVSASTPRGLYGIDPGTVPAKGEMALARMTGALRTLAAKRHYLPAGVPLIKRVAAHEGDLVCVQGMRIKVNGSTIAVRKRWDAKGRPLPSWQRCTRLGSDEVLLLGDHPWSFDGRYFGVTSASDIIGRAVLLWES